MKKLERLSKQLSSVEEIDSRLSISIRKVTQIVIQDVKFEIISNRTKIESTRYSRRPKIDPPKIDTFYEISRNFEKIRGMDHTVWCTIDFLRIFSHFQVFLGKTRAVRNRSVLFM